MLWTPGPIKDLTWYRTPLHSVHHTLISTVASLTLNIPEGDNLVPITPRTTTTSPYISKETQPGTKAITEPTPQPTGWQLTSKTHLLNLLATAGLFSPSIMADSAQNNPPLSLSKTLLVSTFIQTLYKLQLCPPTTILALIQTHPHLSWAESPSPPNRALAMHGKCLNSMSTLQ